MTPATTAILCLKKRRRNSCHWLRATGSSTGSPAPTWVASDASAPLPTAAALRSAASPLSRIAMVPRCLREPDPRIQDAVQDVGQQVETDDEHSSNHHPRQEDVGVAVDQRVDEQLAHARPGKDL